MKPVYLKHQKKPLNHQRAIKRQHISMYILLAPFLLIFLVFSLIPVLTGVLMSFTDFNGLQLPRFVGMDNYIRLFLQDDIFLIDFKNTFYLAIVVGPVGYLLSFAVAWFINEMPAAVRWIIILLFYSPSLGGNVYVIWKFIFANDAQGAINSFLISSGITQKAINWLSDANYTMIVVLVVSLWLSFNVGFLSFSAGLRGLDRAYYEAAALDGLKNRWQELFYVTLPQMGPQLMFGAVMSISSSFAVGAVNRELTGFPSTAYSTDTIVLHMQEHGAVRFEMGYASAISVVLFILMLVSWILIQKLLRRFSAA